MTKSLLGCLMICGTTSLASAQVMPTQDEFTLSLTPKYALIDETAPHQAVEQHGSQNEANNPLTPKITINLHNIYIPEFEEIDEDANQFLLRGLVPHKLGGLPQLLRFTLPVVTNPTTDGDHTTGVADLTLMDLFIIPKKPFEFGIGPLLVIPMGPESTSSEKWQLGGACIVIAPQKWGLLGALATYQQSFAGDDDRDDVSLLTFQPLAIYNLPSTFARRQPGILTGTTARTLSLSGSAPAKSGKSTGQPSMSSSNRNTRFSAKGIQPPSGRSLQE